MRFRGNVSGNWSVNGNPNGGYLMAIAAHAMSMARERKWTPIITAHYISRSVPGEVELRVEEIACTGHFDRLQAGLFQHGREKIRAMGTFADEKYECSSCGTKQRRLTSLRGRSASTSRECLISPSSAIWTCAWTRRTPGGCGGSSRKNRSTGGGWPSGTSVPLT